jgi:flavin-dependent dehydrogenase
VFDTILLRHAAGAGAKVFEETTAGDPEFGASIRLSARSPQGTWKASCRFLVGADGRNSKVARRLRPQREQSGDSRIGLQWYTASHKHLADEIHLYLLPFGYFGIVNVGPEAANLAMVLDTRRRGSGAQDFQGLIEEMRRANRAIDRNLGDLTPVSPVHTTSPITPPRLRRGTEQIMLVGDARRILEPFTGEGIYFALKDGMAAATVLCARLGRGDAPARRPVPRYWMNRAASRVLRHHAVADAAVSLGAALPGLTRMAARVVAGI